MDFELVSKLSFGLVSSMGTVALVFYNLGQARKVRAELLEKFEEAVSRENIHSTTELFRLIHGLRMSYRDIATLVKNDQCSKIIYALKKTPGMVSYRDGEFRYSGIAGSRVFRLINTWFTRLSIWFFGLLALGSLTMFAFGEGATSIAGFVFLIFCSFFLALQVRQRNYDRMIQNIVEPEHNTYEPSLNQQAIVIFLAAPAANLNP